MIYFFYLNLLINFLFFKIIYSYTCAREFDFIERQTFNDLTVTGLLPLAISISLYLIIRVIGNFVNNNRKFKGVTKSQRTLRDEITEDPEMNREFFGITQSLTKDPTQDLGGPGDP